MKIKQFYTTLSWMSMLSAFLCTGASAGTVSASSTTVAAPSAPVPVADAANQTLPPERYITDWYAPPLDWWPQREIRDYTANTRVPDLFWLKYEGANTLALRIKPIAKEMLQKQAEIKVIPSVTDFTPAAENDVRNRTIGVFNLSEPADDFIELSFKAKNTKLKNAGGNLTVKVGDLCTLVTSKDRDTATKCSDGFTAYKVAITPKKGKVIREITFTVDPATSADFDQEWVIFDFLLRRSEPKARFTDIPQRRWMFAEESCPTDLSVSNTVTDVYSTIQSGETNLTSVALPLKWVDMSPDQGQYKIEKITEQIDGKTYEGVKIVLTRGKNCYLKFPVQLNAQKHNVLSFLAKVDVPKSVKFTRDGTKMYPQEHYLIGDDYPRFYGTDATTMNQFLDTFSFGLASRHNDVEDWNKYGVSQGNFAQHWQRNAAAPKGWKAVVVDLANDVLIGNKSTYLAEVTDWCFYYDTSKLSPNEAVTVTILDPKATSGLMYAGGDMEAYVNFRNFRKNWKPDYSDSRKYLGAPETGRISSPIPFIKNHKPACEIILTYGTPTLRYRRIFDRPLETFQNLLKEKYGMTEEIPVLSAPSGEDNTKFYIGGDYYVKVNKTQYQEDMRALVGHDGFAIRAKGKNIYLYAPSSNWAGDTKGLANGLVTFLANNTDIVAINDNGTPYVYDVEPSGNMDIVWADAREFSPLNDRNPGGTLAFNDFNKVTRGSVWNQPWLGGMRSSSACHWWGYGANKNMDGTMPPQGQLSDTCAIDMDGNRVKPDCYTGHPCLIKVLENAKEAYIGALSVVTDRNYAYSGDDGWDKIPFEKQALGLITDAIGLWLEDCQTVCVCENCYMPIRLPDGKLVKRSKVFHSMEEGRYLGNQFYANSSAMINQVNVYINRKCRVENIGYFWMQEPPEFNITRNTQLRFCEYIRKSYMEPVYSPINDIWYRLIYRWGQVDIYHAMYEYNLLFQNAHPIADVIQLDEQVAIRYGNLKDLNYEPGGNTLKPFVEEWVATQLAWNPEADVNVLRKYFIRRAYREAAPDIEKFLFTIFECCYRADDNNKIEFEAEMQTSLILRKMKAEDGKGGTKLDECTRYLEDALRNVKNEKSRKLIEQLKEGWVKYCAVSAWK